MFRDHLVLSSGLYRYARRKLPNINPEERTPELHSYESLKLHMICIKGQKCQIKQPTFRDDLVVLSSGLDRYARRKLPNINQEERTPELHSCESLKLHMTCIKGQKTPNNTNTVRLKHL
jgi:hypothetical protein